MGNVRRLVPGDVLADAMADQRKHGRRIVFTNGCFDLLHPGHIRILRESGRYGDVVIVGINDDDSVRRLKGRGRPIYPAEERAEILLATRWVDFVTVFADATPKETIEHIRPDVLVKGAEYLEKDIVGASFVREYGGRVVRVRMKPGHSTRRIVARIAGTG
ncbi:MAG: adenylyltransferase/cytidyltransferase family protein [bacterium]|nr:adenylyltransferase/cytidyltransferase family protein [bacterium]